MLRQALALLLMMLVPLQAYSAVAFGFGHSDDPDLQHLADHENGVAHHHHDDGAIKHDHSDESLKHISYDVFHTFVAIAPNVQTPVLPLAHDSILIPTPPPLVQTFPDSLFRPPRTFG